MLQEGKEERLEYIQLSHRPRNHTKQDQDGAVPADRARRYSRAAERLKKQRRNRMLAISGLSAVLLVLIVCIVFKVLHKDTVNVEGAPVSNAGGETGDGAKLSEKNFQFTMAADKQEVGSAQEIKEIADYEGYAVRYPVIGNEAMDAGIRQRAEDIVSVFKAEVTSCKSEKAVRMIMQADYESYKTKEELVSVKFDIHKELPLASAAGESVETYTYNVSDGAEISLSDVLKEGFLDLLAEKTKSFAEGQTGKVIETAIAPELSNFKYYTWNEDGLTLYFPGGSLVEGVDDVLSFTVPMEDLKDFLTRNLADGMEGGQEVQGPVSGGKVDPNKPMVCLTFDDGPKSSTTPELLDLLEANDARATFFVVGSMLKHEGAEDIIRRELELGCQVGNHTLDHENLKNISDEEITQQVEGVNDILSGWGLPKCSTVRPPYGGYNNHVLSYVQYPLARWDVDTEDWKTRDAASTINNVLYDEKLKAEDGDIILMHDIHPETIEACRTIIPELKARGFQLVTMEEMFEAKGIAFEPGKAYYSSGFIKDDFGS
ncbi:polysaccharide deacetylase family protein [Lacrimispora sp. NSJ-141]|uniref:Polysaccharide deacetylase family protein n=1 Tax=Lientehia hominis TaxID=2897778 RepID=A0AAP2RLS3_9FIRM|nr:polysaccharide deacetylase family protein [Lientehia hominis]MCD2493605.1 polysaccharide deacetylase family protein [Lientehia hominis]